MDLEKAALFGSFVSKDYAEDLFRLLVSYRDISASEAASRLNLHIRTVQDFLEAMTELGIVRKEEVYEKKRPYFRYTLTSHRIDFSLDLNDLIPERNSKDRQIDLKIRERKNSGARFTIARDNSSISNVVIRSGQGRDAHDRKINLTAPQGRFLYHLPFPTANPMSIEEIMEKAGVKTGFISEILDLVNLLTDYRVIEKE